MRKKVRRILAFLLALAVAMSVMTGMALSAPAESEPEATPAAADVAVEEKQTDATDSTNQAEPEEDADKDAPAEEDSSEDGEAPEEGDPEEPAPDSKKPAGEAGEAAPVSAASEQIATVGSGDRAVTVRTSAAAGVLPEGAKLVVKQLADTDSQYQDAANTLDANQVAYDNFLALDVGFEVNGQEVEPNGSVDVQFELGAGLLPEEADTESLAIQHLADSGKVETVADTGSATNGTVAVQEQKINAGFTVESFSTFTITYTRNNNQYKIKVNRVSVDGEDVPGSTDPIVISRRDTWYDIADYAAVEGYTFIGAHVGSAAGVSFTQFQYGRVNNNSSRSWCYRSSSNDGGTEFGANDIYLVYEKNGGSGGSSGGTITPAGEPVHTKQATQNEDGTYNLTLTVKGSQGSETEPAKVDVLMIVDVSGSMAGDRLRNMQSAMKALVNTLEAKDDVDARYSVVSFSSETSWDGGSAADGRTVRDWGTATGLTNTIDNLNANGGTNYQAGLRVGKTQLGNARKDAQKIVIFLSDGKPTFYIGGGNGSDTIGNTGWTATKNEAAGMSCDQFYSIGIGTQMETYLTGVKDSVNATAKQYIAANSDGSNLTSIFDGIAGSVADVFCKNVTVTDKLSQNAQMVMENGSPKKLEVSVEDENGDAIATPAGITASYNAGTETITMDFPDDYALNPKYTYKVTALIEPTETAYQAYRDGNKTYPDTPDAGTGTHADNNQKGFYCNDAASLAYNNGKEDMTASYAKPVIQLKPGKLIIEKSVTGLTETEIASLKQNLTFTYTLNDGTAQTVKLSDFTLSNGKYTYEAASGLSPNTKYSVSESGADVDGYELTATNTNTSGTIAKGATATASFTNSYELSNRTITLKKVVGGSMGDPNKEFTFSASSNATLGDSTLKHNETTTITAKVGEEVIISESDYTGDGYATTANGVEGGTYNNHTYTFTVTKDMSEATVITFTNTKDVTPPMGVKHSAVPYAIMVGIAAAAGVSYVLVRRRRDSE